LVVVEATKVPLPQLVMEAVVAVEAQAPLVRWGSKDKIEAPVAYQKYLGIQEMMTKVPH
jgi:hypothetical protein